MDRSRLSGAADGQAERGRVVRACYRRAAMTARISLKEVEHVARLARLAITGDEAERLRTELDGILDWMKSLEKLDTTGVPPTTHSIPMVTPLREDVPVASLRREEVMHAAPKTEAFAFAVPKVLEGGG